MEWNIKDIQDAARKIDMSDEHLTDLLASLPKSRTTKENKCFHMYCEFAAQELNEIGHSFSFTGLKGNIIELQWTGALFKNTVWKSLLMAISDKDTTKKSTNKDIKLIYNALSKWFSEKGIYIPYPSETDPDFIEYMKKVKKKKNLLK